MTSTTETSHQLESAGSNPDNSSNTNNLHITDDPNVPLKFQATKKTSANNLVKQLKAPRMRAFSSSEFLEKKRANSSLPSVDLRLAKALSEGDVSRLILDGGPRSPEKHVGLITPRRKVLYDNASSTNDEFDRSTWVRDVLQAYPALKELKERIKPLHRAVSFGKIYDPGRKQVKERLSKEIIIQLVMQHLQVTGYHTSLKTLEQETGITLSTNTQLMNDSRLLTFLKTAVKDIEKVYDLSVADKIFEKQPPPTTPGAPTNTNNNNNNIMTPESQLEEHLYDLGLLEEEKQEDDDVNIWMEREDDFLVEEKPNLGELTKEEEDLNVKAGSLNKLVEKLTSENKHDLNFVKTFLMTYQSFTTPQKLLQKLIQRYNVPLSFKANSEERNAIVRRIRLRVCSVLQKWVADYFTDFDEELKGQLKAFTQHMRVTGETALASAIHLVLSKKESCSPASRYNNNEKYSFSPTDKMPEPNVPRNIFSGNLDFNDIDEEEIARQLTLIEFEIFQKVKPAELLNQAWSKPKLKHRAQNVLAMIERFNAVSNWVGTTIVSTAKVKNRTKILSRFIKIGKHLRNLNNFNSLMAIIAGLNYAAIHRLRFTWDALPTNIQEMYSEIEKVMSSEGAFKNYRDSLKAASSGSCIPYLGVHLTDLVFIDENPDFITHKGVELINFAKRKLIYNSISQIQQLQHSPYKLQPVYQITKFLKELPSVDEQTMFTLSLEREPRKARIADIQ